MKGDHYGIMLAADLGCFGAMERPSEEVGEAHEDNALFQPS